MWFLSLMVAGVGEMVVNRDGGGGAVVVVGLLRVRCCSSSFSPSMRIEPFTFHQISTSSSSFFSPDRKKNPRIHHLELKRK